MTIYFVLFPLVPALLTHPSSPASVNFTSKRPRTALVQDLKIFRTHTGQALSSWNQEYSYSQRLVRVAECIAGLNMKQLHMEYTVYIYMCIYGV